MTLLSWLHQWISPGFFEMIPRIVVGWSMSSNCDGELVEHALLMALARRRPAVGLLHHSDCGSQGPSQAYQAHLEQSGMRVSLSRKGNCWDNGAMESFFGTLKDERIGRTVYASHEEASLALFTYLEVYYNRIRRHSTLGYVSPFIYEQMENKRMKETFDVERLMCYNTSVNATLPYVKRLSSPSTRTSGDSTKTGQARFLPELFVFVAVAGVPLAERSVRPLVIARKISGGTRSPKGSHTRMGLSSLFGTWIAQGLNPFHQCLALLTSSSKSSLGY